MFLTPINSAPSYQYVYVKDVNSARGVHLQADAIVHKFPEILWLADVKVRKTEEGITSEQRSWSEQIFGQKYNEFDRTILTLFSLYCIHDGSKQAYAKLTADQPLESRLSWESFQKISQKLAQTMQSHPLLSSDEVFEMLQVGLVIGDIGKSEKAREFFKPYGPSKPDHDDFHQELMQVLAVHPHLCPSFNALPEAAKEILIKSANLAHYGHINHLEGGPNMFSSFKQSSTVEAQDKYAFDCDWLIFICDVAGALGHVNQKSSLVLTEDCFKVLSLTYEACSLLFDKNRNESDAYQYCIDARCESLELDSSKPLHRILAKIGAMLRLMKKEEGAQLLNGLELLTQEEKEEIILALDHTQRTNIQRTPTYIPAVLLNLLNNEKLGKTRAERIPSAIKLGLPFIAKVLKQHSQDIETDLFDPQNPLNFNPIAGYVKANPFDLQESDFQINCDGIVTIK